MDIGLSLPYLGQHLNGEGAVEMGMTVEAVEGLLRSDADADTVRIEKSSARISIFHTSIYSFFSPEHGTGVLFKHQTERKVFKYKFSYTSKWINWRNMKYGIFNKASLPYRASAISDEPNQIELTT